MWILFCVPILLLAVILYKREFAGIAVPDSGDLKDPERERLLSLLEDPAVFRIVAAVLFVLAAAVRVYQLGGIPFGINQDEAMAMVDAKALGDYGTDRFGMLMPVHFTGWDYAQMSVLLSYLSVPFIQLFGMTPVTVRIPILICSLLGLSVCFMYVKAFLGRSAGLLALFVLAINPWHIMQSRWSLDANLLPHFCMLGIYFLYRGLTQKTHLYYAMAFFGLSMYAYGIAWYAIPLLLCGLCAYLLLNKQVKIKQALLCAGVYLFVAWPIFGVMIINFFHLPTVQTPFFTMPYFPNSVRRNDLLFFTPLKELPSQLQKNSDALASILTQQDDLPWNTMPGFGTLYLIAVPFVLIGIIGFVLGLRQRDNPQCRIGSGVTLIWLGVAVLSALLVNGANVNQANLLFYPLIIACAYGLYLLLRPLRRKWAQGTVLAVFLLCFALFCHDYFDETKSYRFYPGLGEAIDFAERTTYDTIVISDSGSSEIMLMFYAQIDAEYARGKRGGTGMDGTPLLPYEERYRFYDFHSRPDALGDPDVLYIISIWDNELFDSDTYHITWFDWYGLAVLKRS